MSYGWNAAGAPPALSLAATLGIGPLHYQAPMLAPVRGSAYHLGGCGARQLRSFVRWPRSCTSGAPPTGCTSPSRASASRCAPRGRARRHAVRPQPPRRRAHARGDRAAARRGARRPRAGRPRRRGRTRGRRRSARRLRLSLTRSLTGGIAGAIVDAYRARYPDVELDLNVGNTMLPRRAAARRRHRRRLRAPAAGGPGARGAAPRPRADGLRAAQGPPPRAPRHHPPEDLRDEPLVWWPENHGPGAWREVRSEVYGEPPWPPIARTEPEEERIVSAVAEGAGISFIMLEALAQPEHPGRRLPPLRRTGADHGDRDRVAPRRRPPHA